MSTLTAKWEFVVEGRGQFPIDMLRYDYCFPKSEIADSGVIEASFRRHNGNRPYQVTLVGLSDPTERRWESFGFKVITVKQR